MPHDVFISYANEDKAVAESLCAGLEAGGVACWIAPRNALAGLSSGAQTVQAIAQSRIELLVLSAKTNGSRTVLSEVELAANRGKVILPVRIDDMPPSEALEYYLRAVEWFDIAAAPFESRSDALLALVKTLLARLPNSMREQLAENNLPAELTSFIAREAEVGEIIELLESHRLVTITGSGGVGKTRTSLQVAASLLDAAHDGVWFVEFAALGSGDYIPSTIAQAIGSPLSSGSDGLQSLIGTLKPKRALLVFDNCEHLVGELGNTASVLLRACPQLQIVASSRQALGIAGERTYRLPSLGIPSAADAASLSGQDAARYPAIALFAERALAADGHFALSDTNATSVAQICRRLDGIPLAIEMAAARVNVLGPHQLRERLDERFKILPSGSRDALPRQRTLRGLMIGATNCCRNPSSACSAICPSSPEVFRCRLRQRSAPDATATSTFWISSRR